MIAFVLAAAVAVGQMAPDFSLPATTGAEVKLSQYRGKKAVLVAFFPAVFSPGCTAQLQGYRDDLKRFEDAGVEILAISTDAPFSQKAFADAYKLPFPLLSDQDHVAMKTFGVPAAKEHYATRSVYLVDKAGKLVYADPAYKIGASEPKLMEAVQALRR